jgi:hypothetical protein
MANTKLSAFISLLLVFCSGVVVGVFGYRVYNTSVAPAPRAPGKQDPAEIRKQLIDEMKREVQLDAQQVARLGQIYDETRVRFEEVTKKRGDEARAIWDEQIEEIKKMLRPDQVPLYEKLRARKDAEREADRKRRRKGTQSGEKEKKD